MVTEKIIYSDVHSDVDTEAFDYLKEVAFGFEFGSASEVIRKWNKKTVYIKMHAVNNDGSTATPNAVDFAELTSIIAELNDLIRTIDIVLLTGGASDECVDETHGVITSMTCDDVGVLKPDINLFVTTRSRWEIINFGNSASGLDGQFTVGTSSTSIVGADAWVNSAQSDTNRKSLIREEITQPFGLGKDSESHSDSIFYETSGDPGHNTAYSELDKKIIQMLYDPRLKGGMNQAEAEDALKQPEAFIAGRYYTFDSTKSNKHVDSITQNLTGRFEKNGFRG